MDREIQYYIKKILRQEKKTIISLESLHLQYSTSLCIGWAWEKLKAAEGAID